MRKIVLLLGLILLFSGNVFSQDVPRIISYQGVLVGADGKPVSVPSPITITISLYSVESSGTLLSTDSYPVRVIGGLFSTMINIPQNIDLNQQLWLEIEALGKKYPRVKMASALYALNIADNVVTSEKIKDKEVKAVDLSDMGAGEGQILMRRSNTWQGGEIPNELPISANEGDVLVYKNGTWQAEIPNSVPVGTIVAYWGSVPPSYWLLCDGTAIPDSCTTLKSLVGSSTPDLRGMFLRGANITVGEFQDYSTALPRNLLQLSMSGGHTHTQLTYSRIYSGVSLSGGGTAIVPTEEVIAPGANSRGMNFQGWQTDVSGNHVHDIFGGDSETRPKNISVNYIIKAK